MLGRTRFQPGIQEKLPQGLDLWAHDLHGYWKRWRSQADTLRPEAELILAEAERWRNRDEAELQSARQDLAARFRLGREDAGILCTALAVLVEMADRRLGLRPYLEQVIGALALIRGHLLEMATGEGKSLTAALAAVPLAWGSRPCHVLTVNDYLAERDAAAFEPYYTACGVRVAAVLGGQDAAQRQAAYRADLVYTTAKQLLADYLRDRIQMGGVEESERWLLHAALKGRDEHALITRGIDTAIVDEADSVLIDEAVSPLIISRPGENRSLAAAVLAANALAVHFEDEADFRIDRKYRDIQLTPQGRDRLIELATGLPGIWQAPLRAEEILRQSLTARELYQRDQHYVVQNEKVVIVDEFTGRLMPDRSWGRGLHQAIEAKEGLVPTPPTETITRMSFQRFFRRFRRLSGMTGTAHEARHEFWRIYRLPVLTVPTHRPGIRQHWPGIACADESRKWDAIEAAIIDLHRQNRPVLVGTRSVRDSIQLAGRLGRLGLTYDLLNALQNEQEAEIVARAGELGRITIATNMAGRGTDIHLGPGVEALGGLHVIISELHESTRIDRQLVGRSARQGDPGSAQTFYSPEDEVIRRFEKQPWMRVLLWLIRQRPHLWQQLLTLASRLAQGRAESHAFRQRQTVLKSDRWLEESLTFAQRE